MLWRFVLFLVLVLFPAGLCSADQVVADQLQQISEQREIILTRLSALSISQLNIIMTLEEVIKKQKKSLDNSELDNLELQIQLNSSKNSNKKSEESFKSYAREKEVEIWAYRIVTIVAVFYAVGKTFKWW